MLRRTSSAQDEPARLPNDVSRSELAQPAPAEWAPIVAGLLWMPQFCTSLGSWLVFLLSLVPVVLLWQRRGASRHAGEAADRAKGKPAESPAVRKLDQRDSAFGQYVYPLGRLQELPAIVSHVARQLSTDLPVSRVAIFLSERGRGGLQLLALAQEGKSLPILDERLPHQSLVDEAFERSTTQLESRSRAGTTQRIVHLAWPLRYRGKAVGVVLFEGLRTKPEGSEEIALAQELLELVETPIGLAHTVRELEEQARRGENRLRETWAGLEQTLDDLADPAFIHSPDYTILKFNRLFQHRVARPASAILGQKCYQVLFRKSERCPYCPYHADEHVPASHKAEVPQPAERGLLQILSISHVDVEGQSQGALEMVRDSTVEVRLQEQLLHSEKLASIGRLVSGVAHELNNPLTAILGHAQLLDRRAEDSRVKEKVKMILEEAGRASKIVRNLLTFARKHRVEQQVIDLNDVIQKTMALRHYELKASQIQILVKLGPQLPPVVGDFQQLQQVLLNLISNAEHAMLEAHGQGVLTVETFAEDKRICLKVRDNGPGIPPEIRSRIFDPFFTTKPIGKGTGLGLSICFGILSEHRGSIAVESEPGQGATFTVTLPSAIERAEELAGQPSQPFLLAKKKILILSAETEVCDSLEGALKPAGADLEISPSEEEGLAKCLSGGYDLIFAEWSKIAGSQLAGWLGEGQYSLSARCVLLTNKSNLEDVKKFCEQSGASWLQKPVMFAELRVVVERTLRQLSLLAQKST